MLKPSTNDAYSSSRPLVSILVCTYNRSHFLGPTLDSLLAQEFCLGEFEIVVVDNSSTDNTKAVVSNFQSRDAKVKYAYEPRLGVAIARNTGAHQSKAAYIAFFDDDLIAAPDCLSELISPFFQVSPTPDAITGRVDLLWDGSRPVWFPRKYETLLSRFDRGSTPRFMTADEYLITMNVAFERKTFLYNGGIREDLSRKGRMFICGGDTDIFNRYMRNGLRIYYQPAALVHHIVPKQRQTRTWLFKRVLGEGVSAVLIDYAGANSLTLGYRLLYDAKVALELIGKSLRSIWGGTDDLYYGSIIDVLRQIGRITAEIQLLFGIKKVRTLSE